MDVTVPDGVARVVRVTGLTSRMEPPATVVSSPVRRRRNLSPGMSGSAPAKRIRISLFPLRRKRIDAARRAVPMCNV